MCMKDCPIETFAGLGTVVIDEVKTEQGEALVSILRSSGLCLANGRVGQDNFMCISNKGCSLADYCMFFQGYLNG